MDRLLHGVRDALSAALSDAQRGLNPQPRATHHGLQFLAVDPSGFSHALGRNGEHPTIVNSPLVHPIDYFVQSHDGLLRVAAPET